MPDADDKEANKETELWRIVYFAPAVLGITMLLLIFLVFREEPITYCMTMGLEDQGKRHMALIYKKKDPSSKETISELIDLKYSF